LIASVNRHESVALAEKVIQLSVDRSDVGIIGVDLAGAEADFPAAPFIGVFKEAAQAGMQTTIHAGEWGGAANVREAIEVFGTKRIGHGVRVMEDPSVVAVAREYGVFFEVCITSNYQSGVIPVLKDHPFPKMISNGLNAGLHTDDPSICQITLTHEYQVACEELGITVPNLVGCILASAEVAFLPEDERKTLVKSLESELKEFNPIG
jgi:adenosine deaminase